MPVGSRADLTCVSSLGSTKRKGLCHCSQQQCSCPLNKSQIKLVEVSFNTSRFKVTLDCPSLFAMKSVMGKLVE